MDQEVFAMPNRTIYVAEANVPLFEKAQRISGGNLSATIAEALRRFVEAQEVEISGFEEITVEVGKTVKSRKRFQGRLLARGHAFEQSNIRDISYKVYQTPKGNLVVYIRNMPNWNYRSHNEGRSSDYDWTQWTGDNSERRLETYASLEELQYNVPAEVYEVVAQILSSDNPDGVEVLDI